MNRSANPSGSGPQWLLLTLAGLFIVASMLTIALSRSPQSLDWSGPLVWLACAVCGGFILDRYLPGRDPMLFPLAMFLCGWGLVAIERLAPRFADRQEVWLVLSVSAMLLVAVFPHTLRWLRRYRYVFLASALLLLLTTIIVGSNPSGFEQAPRLWLRFGSVYLQPSELMKIILIAFLASYLAEDKTSSLAERRQVKGLLAAPRLLGPMLLMWSLSIVILVWQRDLGTAMLFFVVFVLLLYVRGGDWRIMLGGGFLILLAGIVAYQLFGVVQLRVDIWLNPWPDSDGRAYQIVQSLIAFGAGGIFGSGAGLGSPYYVPVVHSDFVFAALAEEWGLLGVVAAVGCFGVIFLRGMSIAASQTKRAIYSLLAAGLTLMLTVQAIMIMGGVLKLLPLTGVTLPFISYGGSSLLVSFVTIGILLRLSSEASPAPATREIRHIGKAILAALALVALSASYWAVFAQSAITQRNDNPRLIDARARIQRGSIFDRNDHILVENLNAEDGLVRSYREPSTYSLVGYHSLRYGSAGAEAAFNEHLNGSDDISTIDDLVARKLLNMPQVGADIRLTLSTEVQDLLFSTMGGYQGAAVVMDARTGALLALLSEPSYDPNSLDENWDRLVSASGQPFFNRALQGQYQPGSAMMTFWLAEAIQADLSLAKRYSEAAGSIDIGPDMNLGCVTAPPSNELSLREAYTYSCPGPFIDLLAELPPDSIESLMDTYGLADAITIAGFPASETPSLQSEDIEEGTSPEQAAIREALGQGNLTITPLHLATVMSAIAGDGSAPRPHILAAVRDTGTDTWMPAAQNSQRRLLMSERTAGILRGALRQNWSTLTGDSGAGSDAVGAQIALSRSGDGQQTWLTGFVIRENQPPVAFVILLEDNSDFDHMIEIGVTLAEKLMSERT